MGRINLLFILLLFMSFGCQKKSIVKKLSGNRYSLIPEELEIEEAKILDWKVGKNFKQVVSKGVKVTIGLPIFNEKELLEVIEKRDVDSWLIKVSRASGATKNQIGSLYYSLARGRGGSLRQGRGISFAIFYAAASMSKRFENFKCPAFDHSKILNSVEVESRAYRGERTINVSAIEDKEFRGRPKLAQFNIITFNGGMSLEGTYFVDVALYNSEKRRLRSSFFEVPQSIVIGPESSKTVKGCSGFRPPPKDSEKSNLDKFKWKK